MNAATPSRKSCAALSRLCHWPSRLIACPKSSSIEASITARVATSALLGSAASRAAVAATASSNSASSTQLQISPRRWACSAASLSPVIARPSACARPTSRGSSQVPPASGIRPIFENAWMKLAERLAMTRSQASARLAPAPAATPLTAATTGTGMARSRN